jgi:hypothetical protein
MPPSMGWLAPVILVAKSGETRQNVEIAGEVPAPGNQADRLNAKLVERCDGLFQRLHEAGVLRPTVDPIWARRVYYALLHEVCESRSDDDPDPQTTDELAMQIVDTLRGVGGPNSQL